MGKILRPTELIMLGNPEVGTQLMQCGHSVAIDLPQKSLVWEDENGRVWLTYNAPGYLVKRHNIGNCIEIIKEISGAPGKFAEAATGG